MKANTEPMAQTRDEKGRITGGTPPAGFNKHPENQSPGGWDKNETISYWYNKLGRMSDKDLKEFIPANQNQKIALVRVKRALIDDKDSLPEAKEITDRTEGRSPQTIDLKNNGESFEPIRVEIINAPTDNTNT